MVTRSKKLLPLLLLLSFSTFNSFGQDKMPKKYQSLLWEITGNGLKKPSYLYGTMHVSDKMVFNLPDSFFVALKNSDQVALELDMDKWMDDIMMMDEAEKNQNTASFSSRAFSFYRSAFSVGALTEDDLKAILQFSPSLSNRLMYRNSKQNSDYEEDNYLDVFIFQAGKKLNKKIIGLEVYKRTEELSKKAEEQEDDEEDEKKMEEEMEQRRLRLKDLRGDKAYYEMMEDAYRKGDLDMLDSMSKLSRSNNFIKYMLYERNEIMANRMDSVMRVAPLFTGVGAAHLPGQKGIIEMLRSKGYTVRPVNSAKSDIKSKNVIDDTRFPTNFLTRYSSDSVFSVSMPGKLYEFHDAGSYTYYLYNDMSNGSYYCIQRMNHYGKLLGESAAYLLSRIDSLIFENIPGKLLSKKEIKSANGYPGIEIVNKTSKGDVQKHQIFISPLEIFSFKMNGIQEYVTNGKEAELFFSSISFYEPKADHSSYRSRFGYSMTLPGHKTSYSNPGARSGVQQEIVNAAGKNGDAYALAISASLYDFDYIEEDTFELNMLAERFALETNHKIIAKKESSRNGHLAMRFALRSKIDSLKSFRIEIIISGPDYFLIGSNSDSASAFLLFDSFKILPKTYTAPFIQIKDTLLHFTATAQEITNEYSSLVRDDYDPYRYLSKKKKKESKEKDIFLPVKESRVYTSPETNEKVYVEFRKLSMYFQMANMEAFWKSRVTSAAEISEMKVSRVSNVTRGNRTEYDLLLTDTGSTRGILVRFIQRCGTQYMLRAVIDTTRGLEGFSKTFFDSFLPKDSCMGIDVTSDKLDLYFFNKIYSADTTESKKAKAAIEYVAANMLPGNLPSLMRCINDKGFNALSTIHKKELIECFDFVHTKETLPFLEALYNRYTDSVEIELTVLKTLAKFRSKEATETFLRLLKDDLPVTANEYGISGIFNFLDDSLQTAQWLFPGLIKYAKYPEYRNTIYSLMAELTDAGILKPKVYSRIVDEILMDANYELKKYISEKDRDKEGYRYSYRASDRVSEDLNTRQQKVYNYICVLAPFYKNKGVKKIFDKTVSATTSDKFKAAIYAQLAANDVVLHDSIFATYLYSTAGRMAYYKILKDKDKLRLFDKNQLKQKELVISQLFGSDEKFKKDTLVLMGIHKVTLDKKSGNVYVFKIRPKDKKIWKICYSAVHPVEEGTVNLSPQFTKTNISFETDAQSQKEIDSLLRKIRVESRKRASPRDFEKSSAGGYYYDY